MLVPTNARHAARLHDTGGPLPLPILASLFVSLSFLSLSLQTFKFITDNTADQRKVDHLTGWLATEACNPERAPPPPAAAPAPAPSTASRVHNPRPKMSGAQRRKAVRAARAAGGGSASVLSGGEAARANQTAGQRAKVAAKVAKAAARKARRDERKLLRNAAAALASSGIAPK